MYHWKRLKDDTSLLMHWSNFSLLLRSSGKSNIAMMKHQKETIVDIMITLDSITKYPKVKTLDEQE